MDNTQDSALKYAQKHGLFRSHRHDAFTIQSCLASIQNCLDNTATESFKDDSLGEDPSLSKDSIEFDQECLTEGLRNEARSILQTRSPFSYRSDSLHGLLLELPDMEPSSLTNCHHVSDIFEFAPSNWFATQYLPLISVDQKKDEGLDFPPHVDRLHEALQYKVDDENVVNTNGLHSICERRARANDEVESHI